MPANGPLPSSLPWSVRVDGPDLIVEDVVATCFGGRFDSGDNGQTESGLLNDGSNPKLFGVALPIRSTERATRDSPLAFTGPHIPWQTVVMVWSKGQPYSTALKCLLIDNGPDVSRYPTHALDLNPPAALHFMPNLTLRTVANAFMLSGLSYRIMGAAKYVTPTP